jgi:hypothetical protein
METPHVMQGFRVSTRACAVLEEGQAIAPDRPAEAAVTTLSAKSTPAAGTGMPSTCWCSEQEHSSNQAYYTAKHTCLMQATSWNIAVW